MLVHSKDVQRKKGKRGGAAARRAEPSQNSSELLDLLGNICQQLHGYVKSEEATTFRCSYSKEDSIIS